MRNFVAPSVLGLSLSLLGVLAPATAEAHFRMKAIDMTMPVSWMSETDNTGGPQKDGPCGGTVTAPEKAGTPTKVVTNVKAGQMVSIAVEGTVGHTGWYRVSLVEGGSAAQTITTLPDPKLQTKCNAEMLSNPTWSPTQPVIGDGLPSTTGNHMGAETLKVTIPATASCTTAKPCTLQVVMVMTDHAPPTCFYHHCADITFGGGAGGGGGGAPGPGSGGAGGAPAAGGSTGTTGSGGATSSSGGAPATGSGGTSASGGSSATGGSSASGGTTATSSGGSSGSGGITGTGGALASGGTTASGGNTSSGGTPGSGGISSSSGGTSGSGANESSGGCAYAARSSSSGRALGSCAALFLAGLLLSRRARRG